MNVNSVNISNTNLPPEMIKTLQEVDSIVCKYNKKHISCMVIGKFNSGKSSFINALFGVKLLPTRSLSCTSIAIRVKYSPFLFATSYKNGIYNNLSLNEAKLSSVIIEKNLYHILSDDSISEINIGLPNQFLKNGIEIIDTKGIDDDDDGIEYITENIDKVDVVILVANATMFFSKSERDVLDILENNDVNVFICINHSDKIDMNDRDDISVLMNEYINHDSRKNIQGYYFVSSIFENTMVDEFKNILVEYVNVTRSKILGDKEQIKKDAEVLSYAKQNIKHHISKQFQSLCDSSSQLCNNRSEYWQSVDEGVRMEIMKSIASLKKVIATIDTANNYLLNQIQI